ncbi:MAG: DUF427 domain-containing protein [Wenzhouxiangellaceae bacterium]|nr:DUF427 domain-containing protein [Wenzhouxiangellaceae bacterium]
MNPAIPKTESVWDYPRPPRIEAVDWHLKVEHDGRVVAETRSGVRVLETSHPPCFYFPPADVDFSRLVPSDLRTFCEWKGQARYWHLEGNNGRIENACWVYPDASDERIKDFVSFYAGRVDACFVAGERIKPQAGDFYGGWITCWVTGPFKGGPGTRGW